MEPIHTKLSPFMRILATFAISLCTFMFVLDYTIANVAVPYIAGGLAAGVDEGTYVLTFFAVGNAVLLPMTGYLSRRFGNIKTLIVSVALFTFFSWLCAIAFSLESLVFFRFLQGASAGPIVPLSQGILAFIYPKNRLNMIMGIFSMVVLVAPVFGPIVGGYFCVYYDWRWIFNINVPIGVFCTFAIAISLLSFNTSNKEEKVDSLSFFLLLIGMTALQLFLDKGQQWDWFSSDKIRICATLAFLSIIYLILWSFVAKNPLMHLRLFRNRDFAIATILIFLIYSLYMGSVVLVPLWLQTSMGYDALWAGIAVSPIGIGSLFLSPLIAKALDRCGRIIPMFIGFILMGLANLYTRFFYPEIDLYHIMLSRFFLGLGISFWVVPLIGMPASALSDEEMSNGLGIFHFVRSLSGGIGMSIYTTMFTRRSIHQHLNIIENVNPFRPESVDYLNAIQSLGFNGETALTVTNKLVDQQAAALAFDEVSLFMSYLCFFLCIILLFAKGEKKGSSLHVIAE